MKGHRFEAAVEIEVPFHDVDTMQVVWHGHYTRYFELARTALMRRCGLDVPELRAMGIVMPVVDLRVKYRQSLVYGRCYKVFAAISEFEYPKLGVDYRIVDAVGEVCASARTEQVYCGLGDEGLLLEVPGRVMERFLHFQQAAAGGGQG